MDSQGGGAVNGRQRLSLIQRAITGSNVQTTITNSKLMKICSNESSINIMNILTMNRTTRTVSRRCPCRRSCAVAENQGLVVASGTEPFPYYAFYKTVVRISGATIPFFTCDMPLFCYFSPKKCFSTFIFVYYSPFYTCSCYQHLV